MPASRRNTSRAPRPHGSRPCEAPASSSSLDEELEAVFTGISGARNQSRDAENARARAGVVFQRAYRRDRVENFDGTRPLNRDQRVRAVVIFQADVACAPPFEQFPHLGGVRSVHDEQPIVVFETIKNDVVVRSAAFVAKEIVPRLPRLHRRDVIDGQGVRPPCDVLSAQRELAHMREIEEAGAIAHRIVLAQYAGVLHGHLETAEGHHARAERGVRVVKRRSSQDGVVFGVLRKFSVACATSVSPLRT
jgi:hypothetical protein